MSINTNALQQRLHEVETVLASRDPVLASLIARLGTGVLGELGAASAALMQVQHALSRNPGGSNSNADISRHKKSRLDQVEDILNEKPMILLSDPMQPQTSNYDDQTAVQSTSLMRTPSRRLDPFVRERVEQLDRHATPPALRN